MSLAPLIPIDTRPYFRPVSAALVGVLRRLQPDDWARPTVAGHWVVRDVLAHLLDITLRRLSFHRDGMAPPAPTRAINAERDFVDFINDLNAQWIGATKRLSPQVLTDWYSTAGRELADWFESAPLGTPALFGVSWAGERESENWFDIGREFTELWHHQRQIRMAVGRVDEEDPRFLNAVIDVAMRGLPHALRGVAAAPGDAITIDVTGPAGGRWTATHDGSRWRLWTGMSETASATIRLDAEVAWRLLFNALGPQNAHEMVQAEGRGDLIDAVLRSRSVIV